MPETITCQTCGELFTPRKSGGKPQTRCSEKCRRKAANTNYVAQRRPERVASCAECGGPVVHIVESGRPRRFCSDACKVKASNRRANRARLPLGQPTGKTCAHCGRSFTAKSRDRIYCYDRACNQAAYQMRKASGVQRIGERTVTCDGCGTAFKSQRPEARWCSTKCANRHWGNVRARQRGTLSSARYTDREIFERDGWICQLCHEPVDRVADRLHPDGATIDHVIPLSKGGSDEPDNVVTAHWRCNRDKGARLTI